MQKFKRLLAACTVIFLLIFSLPANAQQTPVGSGLSISPTLFEFSLKPGQADKVSLTIKNVTSNKIIAQVFVNDFESDGTSGTPKLITDPNKQSPNSIRRFVLGANDIPLDVNQQTVVTLPIQIPSDTAPGAYFGVIRYKAVPTGAGAPKAGEVALSASVGTIVLITVPGKVREQVQLAGLHIYGGDKEHPRDAALFFTKPNQVGVGVRNLGNGFIKPFGAVEIHQTLGKTVYSYQLNGIQRKANVLPSSQRIFIDPIKNINRPGRYTVTANVSYGSGSQVLVLKKSFWYIPIWLLTIILAALVLVVLTTWLAYRRLRGGRRRFRNHRGY